MIAVYVIVYVTLKDTTASESVTELAASSYASALIFAVLYAGADNVVPPNSALASSKDVISVVSNTSSTYIFAIGVNPVADLFSAENCTDWSASTSATLKLAYS